MLCLGHITLSTIFYCSGTYLPWPGVWAWGSIPYYLAFCFFLVIRARDVGSTSHAELCSFHSKLPHCIILFIIQTLLTLQKKKKKIKEYCNRQTDDSPIHLNFAYRLDPKLSEKHSFFRMIVHCQNDTLHSQPS